MTEAKDPGGGPPRQAIIRVVSGHGDRQAEGPDPATLYAPHSAAGRFFQPWGQVRRGIPEVLRWKLGTNEHAAAKRRRPVVPVVANDGSSLARHVDGLEATWVGHATVALHAGRQVIVTDPHFGPRAFLPPRITPPGLPVEAVPEGAVALLSHNHYDHLDEWTVARLPAGTAWMAPLGLGAFLRERGVAEVHEFDWWQSVRRGGWTFTCLPAQHWSRRLGQSENTTLWCGWLAEGEGRRIYYAGDSGYFHGFAEIGRRFPGIDLALLPIGAYEPRWFMEPVHMNPADALCAFRDLGARVALPVHWGCFDLTDAPVDLAPAVWHELAAVEEIDPARTPVLAVGERWVMPPGADR